MMLHEITHTSIGLEDIHPPAFYELLEEIKSEYRRKLLAGEVELETDDYGCSGRFIANDGSVSSVAGSAADVLGRSGSGVAEDDLDVLLGGGDCGASKKRRGRRRRGGGRGGKQGGRGTHGSSSAGYTSNVPQKQKKRPLLKGAKMVDRRTKAGKAAVAERENVGARDLAARAAMARFGGGTSGLGGGTINAAGTIASAATTVASDATNATGNGKAAGRTGDEICIDDSSSNDEEDWNGKNSFHGSDGEENDSGGDDDDPILQHTQGCGCRSCDWSKMIFVP